jgi:hypothetical protein
MSIADVSWASVKPPLKASRAPPNRLNFSLWCGLPVAEHGSGADHADLQYRRHEPSSSVQAWASAVKSPPAFHEGRLCPYRGDPRWCRLAQEPRPGSIRQCHFVGAAALQPGVRSGSSGFGTICAATGSPTRNFVAWRTSWTPARWLGTGSPPITA